MYGAAIRAADPRAAVSRALASESGSTRVWIIAIGKAAAGMADGALEALRDAGRPLAGGIVIGPPGAAPHESPLAWAAGNHPLPDADSSRAADALGAVVARVRPGEEVRVLLSGGATSLLGAPLPGISLAALRELFRAISRAGLDIHEANAIRRRFLRWGGGRLAAALVHARVQVLAISDVPGDHFATIGSGPCAPDLLTVADLALRLERHGLREQLPGELSAWLDRAGADAETPKPAKLPTPPHRIILRNADALEAAAAEARRRNYFAEVIGTVEGEASEIGERIGARLATATPGSCLIWGGESTVTLGANPGHGGRSQELALAAAVAIAATNAALLAAGTDGRDGPTDAAGAIVDGETLDRLRAASVDVPAALARHDVYAALDGVGALFRPGPTGTNVMDVVFGLRPR
ncbi:MAG: glycerate kinase type-2 family protein [Gemmatimonadota bacterium]